jgi:hypothetical protein
LIGAHVVTAVPWTARLAWVVQVMPAFFIVRGYASGVSWCAARRDGRSYAKGSSRGDEKRHQYGCDQALRRTGSRV